MSQKAFAISGPEAEEPEGVETQIDSSSKPQKKQKKQTSFGQVFDLSGGFGGECVMPGEAKTEPVQIGGLNATVMKPKKSSNGGATTQASTSTAGGAREGEDDPMGMIPSSGPAAVLKPNMREVSIKGGQFSDEDEPRFAESGTGMDPPVENQKKPQKQQNITNTIDEAAAKRMQQNLESKITDGRRGGKPSDELDSLMVQMTQLSSNMVTQRKELLSGNRKPEQSAANQENADKADEGKQEKETNKESNKEKRNRLREMKKQRQKENTNTWRVSTQKTQEEMDKSKYNAQFEQYYKGLGIIPEEEWQVFYAKLKEPLDISFRINSIDKYKERTMKQIEAKINDIKMDPIMADRAPVKVKWYPNQLAYCFNDVSRLEMRKAPAFKGFHQYLVQETENGRLFRQEKVSMVPVTLLKIETDHAVLDMCAAPGSKTIQILEYLHAGGERMNKGFVIANDTDMKRAYMLTHQARRLNSPSLFVINNDARFLPNLRIDPDKNNMKFDRILCDVPCSGDGTFRKNLGLWKNFHSHMGHGNHALQLDILERGFKLLKKGGRIVYSTCTFNPIEDEAVVAAALARHLKQMKIVDVSKEVSPHLKYRPGLTSWKVFHRGKGKKGGPEWYKSFDDIADWRKKVVKETMFTSTYTDFNNDGRTPDLHDDPLGLKHCMRFYPQDDNQGGFFVCVMEKIFDDESGIIQDDDYAMDPWENPMVKQKEIIDDLDDFVRDFEQAMKDEEAKTGQKVDDAELIMMKELIKDEVDARIKKKQEATGGATLAEQLQDRNAEDESKKFPFIKLMEHKPELWTTLQEFFGIDSESFPYDHLAFQQDTNRNVILLNQGLNELMTYRRKTKLSVVNIGLKIFGKNKGNQKSNCEFRILQEGVEILLPCMQKAKSRRLVQATKDLFRKFTEIHDHMLTFEQLKNEWKMEEFEKMDIGSAVMCFDDFAITVWIGQNNVSLMISKEEINSLKFLMDN